MNEIKIFQNPEFGEIRTMSMPDGQVGFVGKDVAVVLNCADPPKAIKMHVDDEDKLPRQISSRTLRLDKARWHLYGCHLAIVCIYVGGMRFT